MKEEKKYQLVLTETQMHLVQQACEAAARIGFGQAGMAVSFFVPDATGETFGWEEERSVDAVVKPRLGLHPNSSFGVGSRKAHKSADSAWDISQTIRHRLSWDKAIADGVIKDGEERKWPEMSGVNYDPPMFWAEGPRPEIKRWRG